MRVVLDALVVTLAVIYPAAGMLDWFTAHVIDGEFES